MTEDESGGLEPAGSLRVHRPWKKEDPGLSKDQESRTVHVHGAIADGKWFMSAAERLSFFSKCVGGRGGGGSPRSARTVEEGAGEQVLFRLNFSYFN